MAKKSTFYRNLRINSMFLKAFAKYSKKWIFSLAVFLLFISKFYYSCHGLFKNKLPKYLTPFIQKSYF